MQAKLREEEARARTTRAKVAAQWNALVRAADAWAKRHAGELPASAGACDAVAGDAGDDGEVMGPFCPVGAPKSVRDRLHDVAGDVPDVALSPDPATRTKARADLRAIRRALGKATKRQAVAALPLPEWGSGKQWLRLRCALLDAETAAAALTAELDKPAKRGCPPGQGTNRGRPHAQDDAVILCLAHCWRMVAGELPAGSHDDTGRDDGEFAAWVMVVTAALAPPVNKRLRAYQGPVWKALGRLRDPCGGPLAVPDDGTACEVEGQPGG